MHPGWLMVGFCAVGAFGGFVRWLFGLRPDTLGTLDDLAQAHPTRLPDNVEDIDA